MRGEDREGRRTEDRTRPGPEIPMPSMRGMFLVGAHAASLLRPPIILNAITEYDLGKTIAATKACLLRRFKKDVPPEHAARLALAIQKRLYLCGVPQEIFLHRGRSDHLPHLRSSPGIQVSVPSPKNDPFLKSQVPGAATFHGAPGI